MRAMLSVRGAAMSVSDMEEFLSREYPQSFGPGRPHRIEAIAPGAATVRLEAGNEHLRPGGTVSGPALMALADVTMYVALLAELGPVTLAVTTNLNINFLRKPEPGAVIADAHLIKVGRRLAVGEIGLRTSKSHELVAHCVATYSIPSR
ncbi:hotdog domain-containing protein [Azorhizobium doebereinerae]|uniref:PaaI family thioesterase n=1 Tax=Azorhizobium doebereinerae TaxID=281091 RepID=UPI0004916C53